jgi:hypothetical protein
MSFQATLAKSIFPAQAEGIVRGLTLGVQLCEAARRNAQTAAQYCESDQQHPSRRHA